MADWNVQLKTAGLNQWIGQMEQNLTRVRDKLDVMESELGTFKNVLESSAGEQWEKGFKSEINRVRVQAAKLEKLTLAVGKAAKALAEKERSMAAAAEKLR